MSQFRKSCDEKYMQPTYSFRIKGILVFSSSFSIAETDEIDFLGNSTELSFDEEFRSVYQSNFIAVNFIIEWTNLLMRNWMNLFLSESMKDIVKIFRCQKNLL